jgi:hypothetical protein
MEEAKAMLAKHALEQEIAGLRRRQPKEQTAEYLHSAPRLLEALEGGVGARTSLSLSLSRARALSLSLYIYTSIYIHIHIASQGLCCGAAS